MQSRGIIRFFILFSIYFLRVYAIDCQSNDSCSQVDALLAPCNSKFTRPNPGDIAYIRFSATDAKCYCNQVTYNQLKTCSTCINNSGNNIKVQLDDLPTYQGVCKTFGVDFVDAPAIPPAQSTNSTTNSTTSNSDNAQINHAPDASVNSDSKPFYIGLAIVAGVILFIILTVIICCQCYKRRQINKSDNTTSEMNYYKSDFQYPFPPQVFQRRQP